MLNKIPKKHTEVLFHLVFVEIISLTQIVSSEDRTGVFLANHLASTDI